MSTEEGLAQVAAPQKTRGEVEALVRRIARSRDICIAMPDRRIPG